MIDVCVLGCGPIRTGKGAAAPYNGVQNMGKIWPVGGFDTRAKLQWEDLIGSSILAEKMNHTTINHRVRRLAVGRNGGPVCGDGNEGESSTLGGGVRHCQLVTGRSISMAPPTSTP